MRRWMLDSMPAAEPTHFMDLYAVDAEARERAGELVESVTA